MALWRAAGCGQQSKLTVVNVPYYVKSEAAGILRRVQLDVLHRVPREIRKVYGTGRLRQARNAKTVPWIGLAGSEDVGSAVRVSRRKPPNIHMVQSIHYTRVYLK